MHELDYGSFQIQSDLGESTEMPRVEVQARCICGVVMWAAAQTFVKAKTDIEALFAKHARDAGTNATGAAGEKTD